jgi:hypothetical protein
VDCSAYFAEAELGVEGDAVGVVKFGVAGEFAVAVVASPIFDELQEGATDALAAVCFGDEPTFEVRDGCIGGAFDVVATDGDFRHADDFVFDAGEGDESFSIEKLLDFERVAFGRAIRPEGVAEFGPGGGVLCGSDKDFRVQGG